MREKINFSWLSGFVLGELCLLFSTSLCCPYWSVSGDIIQTLTIRYTICKKQILPLGRKGSFFIILTVHTLLRTNLSKVTKHRDKGFGNNLLMRFLASVNGSLWDFCETYLQPHIRLQRPLGTNTPRGALSNWHDRESPKNMPTGSAPVPVFRFLLGRRGERAENEGAKTKGGSNALKRRIPTAINNKKNYCVGSFYFRQTAAIVVCCGLCSTLQETVLLKRVSTTPILQASWL